MMVMKELLDRVEKDYAGLSEQRDGWVTESEIPVYIKSAPWNSGAFLRKEFAFTGCFKKGHEYFYLKEDLIALARELKERNIDLRRYKEYLEDRASFEQKMKSLKTQTYRPFHVRTGLRDIETKEIEKPSAGLIQKDLERLKQEFTVGRLEGYIDIYKGNHAMLRNMKHYEKYLDPGLRRRCRRWCSEFNYANHALEKINYVGREER